MERTITMQEVENSGVDTWSVKDNSVRGMHTAYTSELKPGDEVVIDNYFTIITEATETAEEPTAATAEPFENLKNALVMEQANTYNKTLDYINRGYYSTWAEEHRTEPDRGLKEYSTAARWEQYKAGTISREKAVELAAKRAWKQSYKKLSAQLEKLAAAAAAPMLEYVEVSVDWVRSQTWGYNPNVTAWTNDGRYYGRASGCGYDKRSAAVAQALNASNSVLKVLYSFKEEQIKAGKNDHSETATSGHDNRYIIGYGAGYTILPYFEGGVGVNCFWSILDKCGFTVRANERGKHNDYYTISKKA